MLLVRLSSSQLPPDYNLASGGDTCHSFSQTHGERNRAGGKRRGGEPGRGGMGNIILKGNEELLKHESRGKGREAQRGGVGGKESRAGETVAKKG